MRKAMLLFAALITLTAEFSVEAAASGISGSKPPTERTIKENAKYRAAPFDYTDARDAEWVKKGFIARVVKGGAEPLQITKDDGSIVWDMSRYAYISGDIKEPSRFPDTVNPSLWRQAILNVHYGLYEVVSCDFYGEVRSIYQVRGYDLANMSFVETQNGFIVVDVTSYKESAAAAIKLLYDYLPAEKKNKKIHTVIYTHSHIDHYGGVLGVLESGKTAASVAIVAPDGFMEAAVSENVTAGPAMSGRSRSMYGSLLWRIDIPQGRGQLNNGLAVGSGYGTSGLTAPTRFITQNGSVVFDGTTVEFLLAPHTEAPAEMAMLFPDYRSLCLAEICNQTQHNILTPRGAEVRDTIAWSGALDEMKRQWIDAGKVDSAWGPHTWPRWGKEDIADYVGKQSRLYRYIHDQTVFLMNQGYDMEEIAEVFEFPPDLAKEWFNRGYYGTTIFNVKAVYQKYVGWFDNNPASLWKLPEKMSAEFYAKYLPLSGGNLLNAAKLAYDDGQYRWVIEVLEHIRLAPKAWGASIHAEAMQIQADAFEQMAYSAESGIWRNYFLTGAWRNRDETIRNLLDMPNSLSMGPDTVRNMDTSQILETLSTQINGLVSSSNIIGTILWQIDGQQYDMRIEDYVLWTRPISASTGTTPDTTITLTRDDLNLALSQISAQTSWLDALLKNSNVKINGNANLLSDIAGLTHIPPPSLPSITDPEPEPEPEPKPKPEEKPSLILYWDKDGTLLAQTDSVIAEVAPSGWQISRLKITRIGDALYSEENDHILWNGLSFDIVSNDASLAVRSIDITGTLLNEEKFGMSVEARVAQGAQTKTLNGKIAAGYVPGSNSGCQLPFPTMWVLFSLAVLLFLKGKGKN